MTVQLQNGSRNSYKCRRQRGHGQLVQHLDRDKRATFIPPSLTIPSGSSSASFTYTDTKAGTPTITASSANSLANGTQGETVQPGTASKLVMGTEPSTSVTAGAVFGAEPVVDVEDTYGNVLTGDNTSSVNVGIQTGLGSLSGTISVTVLGGVATFTGLDAPTVAQAGLKLQFTDTGDGLSALNDVTSITVNPAALDHFTISSISSPQTAGTAITGITLTAQDVFGNTLSSGPNAFTGTVTYTGTALITGTSAGFTAGVLSGVKASRPPSAGTSFLTFIVTGGSPGKTGTATISLINPGAINSYTVSAAAATRATAFNVTVTAKDANGNTVTTDNSTAVTMTSSSANVQFTGNPATLASGAFIISTLDNYPETVTITATDGNGKNGNTSVTVNPATGDYENWESGTWNVA